ncbi:MAG: tRNA (N6-isopentenyl adenosine(37)-C2)-methylthiotransferase MiaB [Candidatus Bipolaricaulota bacterium]|nr:tRNA (N6-isopentenyl adenosine(37)-C2)-methylthiotransferase MiaB [Candidatus Bipolaricaulota bacterium]
MTKRVYIETWGCQMNLHQSEELAGAMRAAGYELVDRLDGADVVLFNGCMVRQKAEEKLLGRLGAVVEEKRRRPVILGVGGCFGQVHGTKLLARSTAVDFVFGTRGHSAIPALVDRVARAGERPVDVGGAEEHEESASVRASSVSAMITITEGCSNFCSYCIVPYARGPMRSRPPERIVGEVEKAVEDGYREVLLLGQNVNSYGRDRPSYGVFAELLRRVAHTGIGRVRFTSSHPRDLTNDVLSVMASEPTVCRHLHLACQSGNDRVLAAMNRGYTRERYKGLVGGARRAMPGLNVTTDMIVGYPRETDAEFEDTLALVEEMRFGSIYAAKYSPRPLTRSALEPDDVPAEEKEERLRRLLDAERRIALEENQRFVGKEVVVLIEGKTRDGVHYGRMDDHRTVVVRGDAQVGDLVPVHVEGAAAAALVGAVRGG